MNSQHGASDGASSSVIRAADRGIADSPNILGRFNLKHIRNGEVLHDEICYNTITDEGLTHLFAVGLLNGFTYPQEGTATESLKTVWYMGLIEYAGSGTMSFSPTLTHSDLDQAGSTEFTNYLGTNRPNWTEKAAIHIQNRGVTNASGSASPNGGVQQVTFTISQGAQSNVGGIFIASGSAQNAVATERLFAIAPTSTPNISVTNNDQILVSYTATIGSTN